jgi:Na+/H+ antiporter NhaD/arsenite permease-like protein
MYPLVQLPTNHIFWELLSYCAGTGGSCLIIGSAAGVMVMGLEKISFGWYLKNISWMALIGFLSGMLMFLLQQQF